MAQVGRNSGLACAFACLLLHCGGQSTTDGPSAAAAGNGATANGGTATSTSSGGSTASDDCLDAGEPEGGCGGEAGESALSTYAALHTACGTSATVNRRGPAVPICFNIH